MQRYPLPRSIIAALFLSICSAHSQDASDRVFSDSNIGPINHTTTLGDLESWFGPKNVKPAEIWLGEGTSTQGTAVFPEGNDQLNIVWTNDFRTGRFKPVRGKFAPVVGLVEILGSNWKMENGVGVGSAAADVQKANGEPFSLHHFESDLSGQVDSWQEGAISSDIHVAFSERKRLSDAEYSRYIESRMRKGFLSSDPEFAKMEPSVRSITLDWGDRLFR